MVEGSSLASANELLAVSFAYFERLLSKAVPPFFRSALLNAIPRLDEERKEGNMSAIFPVVASAKLPSNSRHFLSTAQKRAEEDDTPFLLELSTEKAKATLVGSFATCIDSSRVCSSSWLGEEPRQ